MKKYIVIWGIIVSLLYSICLAKNFTLSNGSCILLDEVEALTACEATFPNASNEIVTIQCIGEKGTCYIKRAEKVKTSHGTFTVYVDGTCSGKDLNGK